MRLAEEISCTAFPTLCLREGVVAGPKWGLRAARPAAVLSALVFVTVRAQAAGPYPALGGVSASADDAAVAGQNPAGMTYFDERASRFELLGFVSESTWESRLDDDGPVDIEEDNGSIVMPLASVVLPVGNRWWLGLTAQGAGFSEDTDDDSPGRYFNTDYSLLYLSAVPSIATRVTDRLSLGASLALTYISYEQDNAVFNPEPELDDGNMNIDADDFAVGFGMSAMYDVSLSTRAGINYRSEIEPELDGKLRFTGLGPTATTVIESVGLQNAPIGVSTRLPQSLNAGILHDFDNAHTLTIDAAWMDFSSFKLAEIYLDDDQITETDPDYDDVWALSASYGWPVNERWRLGVGALWVDDMVDDDVRTMTLRMDSLWSVGAGFEWRWKPGRTVSGVLNYAEIGEAPVTRDGIDGSAPVTGRYTERRAINLRLAVSLGTAQR